MPDVFRSGAGLARAVRCAVPCLVGATLLVSFTATAGQRLDDFDAPARRMWILGPDTVLKLPVPRGRQALGEGGAFVPHPNAWLVPPRLYDAAPVARKQTPDLHFVAEGTVLPAQRMMAVAGFRRAVAARAETFAPEERIEDIIRETDLPTVTARRPDGATPVIARAVSLASTTPSPVVPEIVAMPELRSFLRTTGLAHASLRAGPASNRYAALIDPQSMEREQRCLAEAVYFEARSEPPEGQAAVAQVVLNRVKSGLYPTSVCGVVYQNRDRYLGCQFSFACEGKSLRITEPEPWKQAVQVARSVASGQVYLPDVGEATHYHAKYVRPFWSRLFSRTDSVGQHIFYKPRPGQS